MTNQAKNVPELRFPEFDGEWEEKQLNNIVDSLKGNSNDNEELPVLTISAKKGWMNQKERFSQVIAGNSLSKYNELKKGDLSYNKGNSKVAIYGIVYKLNYDRALVPNVYKSFRPKSNYESDFIEKYFHTKILDKQLRKLITSTARMDGLLNISDNDFYSMLINIPTKKEQQKIGEFFSKLDRQIELEEQKLAKLEEQKKGYMQKIFSQQLGFKDENGNEYPTWQSYKLGNLYKKGKAGGTPKSTESKYYNGEVPFLSISDITEQGKFIMNTEKSITQEGVDNSTAWLVPVNSINYAMYASVGYLSINKIEVATSQAIFNMVFEDNNLVEYIYYYLNHIRDKGMLEKLVGTGTQSNLSASIMKSMYIKLPDYEEMVKITDFLSKVDKLIEKQNQKIDGLKERKKGFLQKMFV